MLEQVHRGALFLDRVLFEVLLSEEDFVLDLFGDVCFQVIGPFLRGILVLGGVVEVGF